MHEPSKYELAAWGKIQKFKLRPISAMGQKTTQNLVNGVTDFIKSHPKVKSVLDQGQSAIAKSSNAIGEQAKKLSDALPVELKDWTGESFAAVQTTLAKLARVGLTTNGIVKIHQKRGHEVESIHDFRTLDLKKIDDVGIKSASWYYPALAAASGAGASFVITGGEFVTVASGGVAAAPTVGVVAAVMAGDLAVMLSLSSRAVAHYGLLYGYDPDDPAEKIYAMSIVNAGTAVSQSAKYAAMADISKLTQALVRNKNWSELAKTVIGKVAQEFNKKFGTRIVKASLGKALPVAGIIVGGTFNWATLERITDVANMAYRRRFLLDKYPHLSETDEVFSFFEDIKATEGLPDEDISIVEEIESAERDSQ
jgi:hypothetical protein